MAGILNRNAQQNDDNDDIDDDDEQSKLQLFFNKKIRPFFRSDKKWFWWNVGFFVTAVGITKSNGFGGLNKTSKKLTN